MLLYDRLLHSRLHLSNRLLHHSRLLHSRLLHHSWLSNHILLRNSHILLILWCHHLSLLTICDWLIHIMNTINMISIILSCTYNLIRMMNNNLTTLMLILIMNYLLLIGIFSILLLITIHWLLINPIFYWFLLITIFIH